MSVARIAIGGLMLGQDERWTFSVQADGQIVGRRCNDVGALRIRHVERNTLPERLSHDYCFATACGMLNVPDHPVDSVSALETPTGPYGVATIIDGAHAHRVWYCNRAPGMIVGVYTCPAESAGDNMHSTIRSECRRFMAGTIFDRPAWGGDDPLTRALLDDPDETAERDHPAGGEAF